MPGIFLAASDAFRYNAPGMAGKRSRDPFRWVFLILLGAGVLALCYIIARGQSHRGEAPARATSLHQADVPLASFPQELWGGLILLTPEQMVQAPLVDGFQSPCGTPGGAMMYDAQPFATDNPARGGCHTGQDLNGIGGNDTDEGEPVLAAGRGLVVYSGIPSEGWGQVVILAHRLPGEDRLIQTLYAHLKESFVRHGQQVGRGEPIGSIGTAGGRYLAHLHFEAVESLCTEAGMPGYHPNGVMNRLNPAELLNQYPAPPHPDAYEAVRLLRLREAGASQPTPTAPLPGGSLLVNPSQFITP